MEAAPVGCWFYNKKLEVPTVPFAKDDDVFVVDDHVRRLDTLFAHVKLAIQEKQKKAANKRSWEGVQKRQLTY